MRLTLLLVLAAVVPTDAGAQACGMAGGTGGSIAVGVARYPVAGGLSGPAFGPDATVALRIVSARAGYRWIRLGRDRDPHIGRLSVAVPLPLELPGLTVCGTGHAGVASLPLDAAATTVLAGGLGVRLAAGYPLSTGRLVPFAEVRGLAARSAGTVFDIEVGATGLSLGVEGGVQAVFGPVTLRLAGSVDGFDDGLGVTPYPAAAGEVGVGLRF